MRFRVRVLADAQALSRVLEHFALRLLLPSRVVAQQVGRSMEITMEIPGLDQGTAQLILEKLRSSVLVEQVNLSSLAEASLEGI